MLHKSFYLLVACVKRLDNNFKGFHFKTVFFRVSMNASLGKCRNYYHVLREHIHCFVGARSLPSKIHARLVRSETVREGYSAHTWVSGAVLGAPGYLPGSKLLLQGVQDFFSSHLTSWQGWLECSRHLKWPAAD